MLGFLKTLFTEEKPKAKAKPAPAKAGGARAMTPQRAELLKNAMAVHKAKRKILDDLSDEDRARLVALAITSLMNEGAEPPPNHEPTIPKKKK